MIVIETIYCWQTGYWSSDGPDVEEKIDRKANEWADKAGLHFSNDNGPRFESYIILEGFNKREVSQVANKIVHYMNQFKSVHLVD